MLDWWHNGYVWLSSPTQAATVNAVLWGTAVITVMYTLGSAALNLRWRHQQAKRMVARARNQARVAVFNSWVNAGGWSNELQVSLYDSQRRQYDAVARKQGDEFYSDYCEEIELAEAELDSTLHSTLKLYGVVK